MGAPGRVGTLKLRRATVVRAAAPAGGEQELVVRLPDGSQRAAIADVGLHGRSEVGDEVVVNVQALDLGLGSGGFDVLHVNLTRGLDSERDGDRQGLRGRHDNDSQPDDARDRPHVMKLNYTSLQHAVVPVEQGGPGVSAGRPAAALELSLRRPVAVLALHGQLAPVAWAFAQSRPGAKLGYVQTPGGALPGGRSRTVAMLRDRGLLAGHVTAGAAFGGEREAMTTAGGLDHGERELGWDAAVCGPGPGIVGSGSALGHGGMQALDSAHTALALGASTLLVARMSSSDPRERHRGISHHTLTVLELLLAPVTVALPVAEGGPGVRVGGLDPDGFHPGGLDPDSLDPDGLDLDGLDLEPPASTAHHDWRRAPVDLAGYGQSGLPTETMTRGMAEDPLFFAAALAGGSVLARLCEANVARKG